MLFRSIIRRSSLSRSILLDNKGSENSIEVDDRFEKELQNQKNVVERNEIDRQKDYEYIEYLQNVEAKKTRKYQYSMNRVADTKKSIENSHIFSDYLGFQIDH